MSQLQAALKSGDLTVDELKWRGGRERRLFDVKLRVEVWATGGEPVRTGEVSRLIVQRIRTHPKVADAGILTVRELT